MELGRGLGLGPVRKANKQTAKGDNTVIIITNYDFPTCCVLSCFVMAQGTAEPRELRGNNELLGRISKI